MTVRHYLSQLIGTGTKADPFRPAVRNYSQGNFSAHDGRLDSTVATGWCLVNIDISDAEHATAIADTAIIYIPFEDTSGNVLPLTATVSQVASADRTKIASFLENHGIDTSGITASMSLMDVLKLVFRRFRIKQYLGADDFGDLLDNLVSSIPAAQRQNIANKLTALGFTVSGITGSMTIRQAIQYLFAQGNRMVEV